MRINDAQRRPSEQSRAYSDTERSREHAVETVAYRYGGDERDEPESECDANFPPRDAR
jgi:hypothetical protein